MTDKNNSGSQNSGSRNSGSQNSGHLNSGDLNSGDLNSGHRNSGHQNSGSQNSGHLNSGSQNSGSRNSGSQNSGDLNSGHRNSGHLNSVEPNILMFNKDTGRKYSEITMPFIDLKINEWISEEEMTNEEKKNNPHFFITKGYLKTIPYKEAWKNFWATTSDEIKNQIKSLPNFDEVVFFDITGIDVKFNSDKRKKGLSEEAEKLIKTAQELLKKAQELI
jgi:PPE-repeat protein